MTLGKHVIIGSGTIILPGVTIGDGTAIGSLSLVKKNVEENIIASGIPAKKIGDRKLNIYELESKINGNN